MRRGTVARVIGWAVIGVLSGVALARLWRSTTVPLLIGIQGLAPWLLLPAYPVLVVAAVRRRGGLAAVAGVLVAVQLAWTVAQVGWHGQQPLPAGAVSLRLVSANVLVDNPKIAQLGDDLAAHDADVVLVQEVTDEVLAALARTALWREYPYRITDPRPFFHGAAVFSRYPVVEDRVLDVAGSPMLLADLRTPAGIVRVVNVHTVAPLTRTDARVWSRQFAQLADLVAQSTDPVVLAGDFNATLAHSPMDDLVEGATRDAFEEAGSGFGATWPQWHRLFPPLMQLDHVLVHGPIAVGSVHEVVSVGSDHRRLVVELGVEGSAPTGPA